jgi:hypothetical protein
MIELLIVGLCAIPPICASIAYHQVQKALIKELTAKLSKQEKIVEYEDTESLLKQIRPFEPIVIGSLCPKCNRSAANPSSKNPNSCGPAVPIICQSSKCYA